MASGSIGSESGTVGLLSCDLVSRSGLDHVGGYRPGAASGPEPMVGDAPAPGLDRRDHHRGDAKADARALWPRSDGRWVWSAYPREA